MARRSRSARLCGAFRWCRSKPLPCRFSFPKTLPRLRKGVRSSDGCRWSFRDACCSHRCKGLALVVSELTEGKGSQPTENPSDKERNALALAVALPLLEPSEGNEPTEGKEAATNQQSESLCPWCCRFLEGLPLVLP